MDEPPWKRMVEELKNRRFQSPYLDRLETRIGSTGRDDLAAEVLREMATALRRAEEKVNVALLELDVLAHRIAELEETKAARVEVDEVIRAFNARRGVAEKALWELRVHREAVGFRREDLAKQYPIPPRR